MLAKRTSQYNLKGVKLYYTIKLEHQKGELILKTEVKTIFIMKMTQKYISSTRKCSYISQKMHYNVQQ